MKLIVLAGNHRKDRKWLDESEKYLSDTFDAHKQYYSHWETGDNIIDFDSELHKLTQNIKEGEEYSVFAKSAGAVLAIYGVYKGELNPKNCFLIGLPIKWASENGFPLEEWLKKFNVPTIIIQNSDDPMASFRELQDILKKLERDNIETIEIPGDDHTYDNLPLLKEKMMALFARENQENVQEKSLENGIKEGNFR